ncbi:MAG: hypothetical protein AAF694_27220 [Bacteroidota bacterium]
MNKSEHQKNLISYLYDEWEEANKEGFEAELAKHPDWEEELDTLSEVLGKLQAAKTPEARPPKLDLSYTSHEKPFRSGLSFLSSPWIQAAIWAMLMMCTAALTGLEVSWNSTEGFNLHFGRKPINTESVAVVSNKEDNVQQQLIQQMGLLSAQLDAQEDSLSQQLESLYLQVDQRLKSQQNRKQSLSQEVYLSEDQFRSIRKELLRENYQLMTDLMEYAAEYQRAYNEQMLGDFAQYLNTQRSEDLQLISLALQEILQQNDIQQKETEILLGQLITNFSSD